MLMAHPGATLSLIAAALLLVYVLLRDCPGVVQRPEPGGGTFGLLWRTYHESLAKEVADAEAGQVRSSRLSGGTLWPCCFCLTMATLVRGKLY